MLQFNWETGGLQSEAIRTHHMLALRIQNPLQGNIFIESTSSIK